MLRWEGTRQKLVTVSLDSELSKLLFDYFSNLSYAGPAGLTYHALDFSDALLLLLDQMFDTTIIADGSDALLSLLLSANFNHLGCFAIYISRFQSGEIKRDALDALRDRLYPLTLQRCTAYDPSLPSLAGLLYQWAGERLAGLPNPATEPATVPRKLAVDLSVAHLACLLRSFYEAGLFPGLSLTELFAFATSHFSTKRRTHVSAGSMSKEYYSITQQTAARVIALLTGLTAELKRAYFPVMAVIGLSVLFHGGTGSAFPAS